MTNWLLFIFLAMAWGGSFLFLRQAAPSFGPIGLIALRLGSASLLLLPFAWGHGKSLVKHWRSALLLGLLNCAFPFVLFAWAMKSLHAGHGAIINAMTPLFVALVGQLFYREKQPPRVWLALGLGLLGVAITSEPWKQESLPQLLPTLAGLAATLSYGFGPHVTKRLKGLEPLTISWLTLFGAFAWLIPPVFFALPESSPPAAAWGAALALGGVSTAAAFVAYFRLWKAWGPLGASLVTYAIPFSGIFLGWMVLGEPIKMAWWPGLALVLTGLALAHSKQEKVPSKARKRRLP